ncbi:FkbM family methyltransferase [Yoonia sp. GPGPB17]|uniref:FkbM family methyltransferase n=1 Tax=Yoonia sp. GPGPB17 TaxID=3026147 RepID=UPI0030BDFFBA
MTAITKAHLHAIHKSLNVYYRDADRTARMDRLNARFVTKGDLAFDIGAHVGDRTGSFLRLGATVVAAEPQPHIFRALRLLYGKCDRANLHQTAVGAEPGKLHLHVNTDNPTITTASSDLIAAARRSTQWEGQVWDSRITVNTITLDALIAQYGVPDFVKIDVEGHELEVLKGLTHRPPALSFEFTTIQKDVALDCLTQMRHLGDYEFNVSLGEDHAFVNPDWADAPTLQSQIARLPMRANSGDVFARLR